MEELKLIFTGISFSLFIASTIGAVISEIKNKPDLAAVLVFMSLFHLLVGIAFCISYKG